MLAQGPLCTKTFVDAGYPFRVNETVGRNPSDIWGTAVTTGS